MAENLAELCPAVMWKADLVSDIIQLRKFPSKVLKVHSGFLLQLIINCKKKETGGKN